MSDCVDHGKAGNNKGYAFVKINGESVGLHRKALLDAGIEIPKGHVAMHSCDNPRCINIEHLSVGTYSDNTMDASRKGRLAVRPSPRGERNPTAKLNEVAVRVIRQLYAEGRTQAELAAAYGVRSNNISLIVNRKTWRHVT